MGVNRARARAMRIRQPPLKSRVFFACISLVKPSPCRSDAARASILSDSSRSNLSAGSQQWATADPGVSGVDPVVCCVRCKGCDGLLHSNEQTPEPQARDDAKYRDLRVQLY